MPKTTGTSANKSYKLRGAYAPLGFAHFLISRKTLLFNDCL